MLQIPTADAVAQNGDDTISVLQLLMQGGFMMIPLLLLSIAAVYIFTKDGSPLKSLTNS